MSMKAVILAAGEGTRLRPFTASEPKVMIPVANKPILQYVVEALVDNDITDILMVVGYQRQRIMSFFGNGEDFGAKIEYVVEWKQLGTAHALYQAKDKVDGDFLVLAGDNIISKGTISDFLNELEGYSILVTRSDEPSKYGVVVMKDGVVGDLIEKPEKSPSHLISTGIYAFGQDIFDYIDTLMENRKYDLTSAIDKAIEEHDINGIITDSMWMDAVYSWDLIHLNSAALTHCAKSSNGIIEKGVSLKGEVIIGEGAVIKSGTTIEGPAIIGEGCEIGPNACILPSTSLGNDTKVSPFTVIQNSIIMSGVTVGPNSHIDSSVIGDGVDIGSSFSTYSGRADMKVEKSIQEIHSIGCMIAEDTIIGSGVKTEPGVIVGSDCEIKSGAVIREDIPTEAIVL